MAQFNPLEIVFLGERRHYYSYDGELYTRTFPFEWAENHVPGTGPKECGNCSYYGCWNGVFIGYCVNCAHHVYDLERGSGLISHGQEFKHPVCDPSCYMSNTYLKDVEFDEIGDTDFMDSKRLVEIYEQTLVYPSDNQSSYDTESVSVSDH
jgi:hypothetical protein